LAALAAKDNEDRGIKLHPYFSRFVSRVKQMSGLRRAGPPPLSLLNDSSSSATAPAVAAAAASTSAIPAPAAMSTPSGVHKKKGKGSKGSKGKEKEKDKEKDDKDTQLNKQGQPQEEDHSKQQQQQQLPQDGGGGDSEKQQVEVGSRGCSPTLKPPFMVGPSMGRRGRERKGHREVRMVGGCTRRRRMVRERMWERKGEVYSSSS